MNIFLDASALMAVLLRERGYEIVLENAPGSAMSIVNAAEVMTSAIERGLNERDVPSTLSDLRVEVIPFDEAHALQAARLRPLTKHLGLGLGDRACLAHGLISGTPVLTGDQKWRGLDIGVDIRFFREPRAS